MAADALEAIHDYWLSSQALKALVRGGMPHADEAPPRAQLPYAVLTSVAGPAEDLTQSDGCWRTQTVQVAYFASSRSAAASGIKAIRDAIRQSPLVVEGRSTREVWVEGGTGHLDPTPGPSGEPVWQHTCDFEVVWPANLA